MKKTAKKLFILISVVAGLIFVTFELIVIFGLQEQFFLDIHSSFVTSEIVYFMLALLLVLPIALLMLVLSTVLCTKPLRKAKVSIFKRQKKKGRQTRFSNLTKLDRQQKWQMELGFETRELSVLCEDFRNFAASRLKLYYDIAAVQDVVGQNTPLVITINTMAHAMLASKL